MKDDMKKSGIRNMIYYICAVVCIVLVFLYFFVLKSLYDLNKETEKNVWKARELIAQKAPLEDFVKILEEPRDKAKDETAPGPDGNNTVVFIKKGLPGYYQVTLTYTSDGKLLKGEVWR